MNNTVGCFLVFRGILPQISTSNNLEEKYKCFPFFSGPNRSVKVTDHFTCISTNVIYCITCTLCKKIYIGETGRRLADRFREHLRDAEQNNTDASKPVARHFNLPNHSHHNMTICGLSLHHGNKISNKNSFFNWVHSLHTELMNASHSTNLFTNSYFHQWQSSSTLSYKPQQPTIPLFALTKG